MAPVTRRFVDWVAQYYCSFPGAVLRMAMSVPSALEAPRPRLGYILDGPPPDRMTPARGRVIEVLSARGELSAAVLAGAAFLLAALDLALRPRQYSLSGAHVLVTGGSQGIGLCVARECLRRGAGAASLVARGQAQLDEAAAGLRAWMFNYKNKKLAPQGETKKGSRKIFSILEMFDVLES